MFTRQKIFLIVLGGLFMLPTTAFAQIERARIFIASDSNEFAGFAGGNEVQGQGADWAIGNSRPRQTTLTDDMVFSTCIGDWRDPDNWIERMRITQNGNVGIGTTNPGTKLDIKASATIGPITFSGSGLNDMATGGIPTLSDTINYRVQIDGIGTPDTFRWSNDGGSTWIELVAITGFAQLLEAGIFVTFGATTGHTLYDYWDFTVTVVNPLQIKNAADTNLLKLYNNGVVEFGNLSHYYTNDLWNFAAEGNAGPGAFVDTIYAGDGPTGFYSLKARGTLTSPTIVNADDSLGLYGCFGFDGEKPVHAAEIGFQVEGAPSLDNMPARIIFFTNPGGGSEAIERMRITSEGKVGIGTTDPQYTLDVEGYVQAQGYYTGDIVFQKNGSNLWRMFEDEDGLYIESIKTGKVYKLALQEVEK